MSRMNDNGRGRVRVVLSPADVRRMAAVAAQHAVKVEAVQR